MSSIPKMVKPPERGSGRQKGVYVEIPENLSAAVRELAAARRVPIKAVHEAALRAYLSPAAHHHGHARDGQFGSEGAHLGLHLERLRELGDALGVPHGVPEHLVEVALI